MCSSNPASGDNKISLNSEKNEPLSESKENNTSTEDVKEIETTVEINGRDFKQDDLPQVLGESDNDLKERIKQCRNIIESLKMELSQEKARIEKESKTPPPLTVIESKSRTDAISNVPLDVSYPPHFYSTCVENNLTCDENLIQYERQLQIYQNTLNMAQIEKKNAIRKQMIAKAYKLKLLEVENQCNIELLRVKQSLQCLEPLQMIANKWKNSADDYAYDLNSFELMPRYPELNAVSGSDVSSSLDDTDIKNKAALTLD